MIRKAFNYVNPKHEGSVSLRSEILFSHDWLFCPDDVSPDTPDSDFESITLPHSNKILPHHNFDVMEYQFISTYRKRFKLPEALNGRRLFVDFDGAMIAAEVYVNGESVGEHEGGFTPFSFDITDFVSETEENLIIVKLDSTERPDIPPFGFVVDYLTFGGIYRDVWLRYAGPIHIKDVFVRTRNGTAVIKDDKQHSTTAYLACDVTIVNFSHSTGNIRINATFDNEAVKHPPVSVTLPLGEETTFTVDFGTLAHGIDLWCIENPALYDLQIELEDSNNAVSLDLVNVRIGIRETEFRKDGRYYLNGQSLKLFGLNRHQTFPFLGAAAPARLQRKDAEIIKYELGCNIVRTSHYPQSKYFLDRCDEIGLLVFEEIPGWQHIGDRDWQGITLRDVESMILRDRNHPSIIIWGVRINESQDNEALYRTTNELAHKLDPTRQTGGVRYFQESQFLEDVFTYNDFSNTVVEPLHTPHLVTEFNGHMFPTKSFDQEERLIEHALRHARVQDKQLGMVNVSGAIGWCAFDYNTHREFGSGDGICYHGVMDIFRLPKYAAYFYESQISPSRRPILHVASVWSMGERSGGGNDPLVVFSNCDEIDVYVGEELYGRFQPDRVNFPNLQYPPFQVTGLAIFVTWGRRMADLRIVGFYNGQSVIEQRIESSPVPRRLEFKADDTELKADGRDMTRLVFRIVDNYRNRLPFTTSYITFDISGPAELIGENPFPVIGGQGAIYVRAGLQAGEVMIRAKAPRLPEAEVAILLK